MLFLAMVGLGAPCLLLKARKDPEAFADFYDVYADRILRYLGGQLLDAEVAYDLMSETFAKALQRLNQFRGSTPEEERAWLFSIANGELKHYWRRGRVESRALRRIGLSVGGLSDDDLARVEERAGILAVAARLGEAMSTLPDEQRHAVELRVVHELDYDEIAERVQASPQAVRARVSRGLRALATGLRERGVLAEDLA